MIGTPIPHCWSELVGGGGARGSDAFGHFYHRHIDDIYSYFLRRTNHTESSHDLAADTFMAALEGVAQFDPDRGRPRQWLYGIAGNMLRGSWRRNKAELTAFKRLESTVIAASAASTSAHESALAAADAIRLAEALERVSASNRIAVQLRIVEQLGYEEIAERLSCSPGGARVRVHRGVRTLAIEFDRPPRPFGGRPPPEPRS